MLIVLFHAQTVTISPGKKNPKNLALVATTTVVCRSVTCTCISWFVVADSNHGDTIVPGTKPKHNSQGILVEGPPCELVSVSSV